MDKIIFRNSKEWGKSNRSIDAKHNLLSRFLDDFQRYFPHTQDETIENLESVLSGEKTFDEIQDPQIAWSFGGGLGIGYLEIEEKTAYFEPDPELTDAPRIVMPLEEVIEILKDWRTFLRK